VLAGAVAVGSCFASAAVFERSGGGAEGVAVGAVGGHGEVSRWWEVGGCGWVFYGSGCG
jgi:hypothetical protein